MIKVSFDFDGVFEYEPIRKFASELISRGIEVHIVTANSYKLSSHVFELTDTLNLEKGNIHFTNGMPKFLFFKKNSNFKFHLDDDPLEVKEINKNTSVKGIYYDENFKSNCLKELK